MHLLNDENNALTLITGKKREVLSCKDVASKIPSDVPTDMNRHFIDCLMNHAKPLITVEEACQIMRVIDACYESVRTGEKVTI